MAKDYAKNKKKTKKSGASRGKNKSPVSGKLIFSALVLVGGLIALLIYLQWFKPTTDILAKKTTVQQTVKKTTLTPEKKLEKDPDEAVPFYQTHEEIINKTVEIPADDLVLPEDEHKYSYSMPCGSFRDNSRADELKAQIAFAGYESIVKKINVKSGIWYRVLLGPFKSKRKAESIRHRLQDNGFNNCKIWKKKIS